MVDTQIFRPGKLQKHKIPTLKLVHEMSEQF